jgi:CelD/BcsL family acetyltransferase involved in cellulose biosynthesis
MRVTVVPPGDLGSSDAALWAKFQQASPVMHSPFLSLTFAQAVGRHRPAARVAVLEDDGGIVAFLPFQAGRGGVAMPIGHPMNNLQAFIGSGAPIDARSVMRKSGLRGWRFISAPADHQALVPHHYEGTLTDCPIVDLTGGYEAYVKSLSKSLTSEIARRRRALGRACGPVSLTWHSDRPADDLRQMIEWKAGKYGGTRELFANPASMGIAADLAVSVSEDCGGAISVLSAGERTVAIALWLTEPEGVAAWFASYDEEFRRSSPGTMILLAVAEEAASRGFTRIDLSAGQDSYKLRLANGSYPVAGGAVWAHRMEQAGRRLYRSLIQRRSAIASGN